MKRKVFMRLANSVDYKIGPDLPTQIEALELIDKAKAKFHHLDIQSFDIYLLEASFPFAAPADASKSPSNSAISSTQESLK